MDIIITANNQIKSPNYHSHYPDKESTTPFFSCLLMLTVLLKRICHPVRRSDVPPPLRGKISHSYTSASFPTLPHTDTYKPHSLLKKRMYLFTTERNRSISETQCVLVQEQAWLCSMCQNRNKDSVELLIFHTER